MGKLIGGPDLRARLNAISQIPAVFASQWASDAAERIKQTHPPAKRAASQRFSTRSTKTRAGVYGAYWWIFVDRGTKAHDITARKAKALRFESGGRTIFARKTHVRRIARRPFITRAAQEALTGSNGFSELVIQSWNRRRLRTKRAFL